MNHFIMSINFALLVHHLSIFTISYTVMCLTFGTMELLLLSKYEFL